MEAVGADWVECGTFVIAVTMVVGDVVVVVVVLPVPVVFIGLFWLRCIIWMQTTKIVIWFDGKVIARLTPELKIYANFRYILYLYIYEQK